MATFGYFEVLLGTLRYFSVPLDTIGYFELFFATSRYFEVLLDTLRYFWVLCGTEIWTPNSSTAFSTFSNLSAQIGTFAHK